MSGAAEKRDVTAREFSYAPPGPSWFSPTVWQWIREGSVMPPIWLKGISPGLDAAIEEAERV